MKNSNLCHFINRLWRGFSQHINSVKWEFTNVVNSNNNYESKLLLRKWKSRIIYCDNEERLYYFSKGISWIISIPSSTTAFFNFFKTSSVCFTNLWNLWHLPQTSFRWNVLVTKHPGISTLIGWICQRYLLLPQYLHLNLSIYFN